VAPVDPLGLDSPAPATAPGQIIEGGPPAAPIPHAVRLVAGQGRQEDPSGPRPALRVGDLPGSGVGPGDRVVALTFDDGPDSTFTPRVIDVLSHYHVRATFFMIGWEAAAAPDLVRHIVAGGNGVGSHTWNHVDLTRQSDAGMAVQVDKTEALLSSETGWKVTCIRPPQGHENPGVVRRLSQRGLSTVLWSADTRDWTLPVPRRSYGWPRPRLSAHCRGGVTPRKSGRNR
jgi:peptidoglycan/xylan/chitin deacetylase (PgdA/CDA1 family)